MVYLCVMADADYAEQTKPSLKHGNGAGATRAFLLSCAANQRMDIIPSTRTLLYERFEIN